jgi:hypothetical protein
LFKERGWVANYLGPYNGGYEGTARREFRDTGITALFEHFAVVEDQAGAPDLCTTDRVWFLPTTGERRPRSRWTRCLHCCSPRRCATSTSRRRRLDRTDAHWADRGDDPHLGYWHQVSFGELTARAEVRRDVLARILPKLAVAGQVELADRYVRVRGKLASYKIHLGSANVLVEPGDRYLCIVPASGKGRKVMLPFDGDEVLSVILAKVVLLAADHEITDQTILSQLTR